MEDSFVHDPCLTREGETHYVFSTGREAVGDGNIQVRASEDLRRWRYVGTVFPQLPTWIRARIPGVRSLWAPDICQHQGRYHLYYAASTFGRNTSVIGLASNATLDPASSAWRWVDHGPVLASTSADDWNAIDPSFVTDEQGRPWLACGSFWTGIQLLSLDAPGAGPAAAPVRLHALARRPVAPHAIEAPCIHFRRPYFYLFVSFDLCCRGVHSTYRIMVGRSAQVTGPYLGADGQPMLEGGGTLLLQTEGAMIGPGGQSVQGDGEVERMVYHYYDALDGGRARLQIRNLLWSEDGWPRVGPPLVPTPEERQA